MEIDILYTKEGLRVCKDDNLLFYSKGNSNFINRIVKVFNPNNNLLLELKIIDLIFKNKYKILFQNQDLLGFNITHVNYYDMSLDGGTSFKKRYNNRIISFNWNYYYLYGETKIAQVKHNVKDHPNMMVVNVNDDNLSFLNWILIHVLLTRTCDPNDD
ncbi:hypothetical protein [Flavobacterium anhuiense]|uniref:hypothetical protein n=1 Tax=Flavobacterium anhuiense TaxID=459526 RepID=UPI003D979AE7